MLAALAPWGGLPGGLLTPLALALLPVPALLRSRSGSPRRWLGVLAGAWLPLAVSLLLVHGLFFPEGVNERFSLGPLRVTEEGLSYGAGLAARYALAFSALGFALAMTSLDGLARVAEELAGRSGLGHPLRAALGLLPAARRRAAAIREAQRARGLRADSPWRKASAVVPLIVPLAASLLAEADTRAAALATRGFGGAVAPTSLVDLPDSPAQRALRRLAPAAALLFLVASHVWVRMATGPGP